MRHRILLAVLLACLPVFATDVPEVVNYQGRLLDAELPADGNYGMTFRIFDDPTATAGAACGDPTSHCLWEETQAVQVTKGVFNVLLGSMNPLSEGVFLQADRWIEIAVDAEVMEPRQRIASAVYAIRAGSTGQHKSVEYYEPDSTVLVAIDNKLSAFDLSKNHELEGPQGWVTTEGKVSRRCHIYDDQNPGVALGTGKLDVFDYLFGVTMEVWVYKTTPGDRGIYQARFALVTNDVDALRLTDTHIVAVINRGPLSAPHGLPGSALNQWVYIVVTWTTGGDIEIFVNGNSIGSISGTVGVTGAIDRVRLGGGFLNDVEEFVGLIDGFRYLGRAMSAVEIRSRYEAFR